MNVWTEKQATWKKPKWNSSLQNNLLWKQLAACCGYFNMHQCKKHGIKCSKRCHTPDSLCNYVEKASYEIIWCSRNIASIQGRCLGNLKLTRIVNISMYATRENISRFVNLYICSSWSRWHARHGSMNIVKKKTCFSSCILSGLPSRHFPRLLWSFVP